MIGESTKKLSIGSFSAPAESVHAFRFEKTYYKLQVRTPEAGWGEES